MTDQDNEHDVIDRVLHGDADAFRYLVQAHQALVFAMIMRQIGNRTTAADLTQETFLKAYAKLATFRGEAKFSTWLVRIALNVTHSHLRSHRYRMERGTIQLDGIQERVAAEDPRQAAQTERYLERLRMAVHELPRHYREAMVLAGLEGRSYEETARILMIPIGTVRSRLNAARHILRKALEEIAV